MFYDLATWSVLYIPYALEKKVYFAVAGWVIYKCQLGQDGWLCHSGLLYLLIFMTSSFNYWERGMKISKCDCGFVYFFSSISLCFMYLKALLLTTYIDIYNCYILIYFIIMKCQWPLLILVLSPCLKVYFIRCWYSHSFHNISVLYILFTFFSGCPRICDILQLTQVHFGCLRKFSFHLHFWRIIL